jgi:lipopolysaccharide transport system ATP-binding protein
LTENVSNPVIKVEGLGKRYLLAHQNGASSGGFRYKRFSDVLIDKAKGSARWLALKREVQTTNSVGSNGRQQPSETQGSREEFWALKDISFQVNRGEVLGIIGRNGAGKSTLLKLLSRISEPTTGRIEIEGRLASLLEVGTGFHPELTGRENIYLNGAILGMAKAEIKRKFDEIVAFAEVEKFLDTPVKRYSSGMYVRLAFAVAAHLDPEILVVDEVLAVGDSQFQAKCLGKMQDIARNEGRTVLFVSHNMSAVRSLCHRGIVLESGQKQFEGTALEAIAFYSRHSSSVAGAAWTCSQDCEKSHVSFERIKIQLSGEQPHLKLRCEVTLSCQVPSARFFVAVDICDHSFSPIMQALPEAAPFIEGVPGKHQLDLEIELPPLIPGIYGADFWVGSHYTSTMDYLRNKLAFEVTKSPSPNRSFPHSSEHGWAVPITHFTYSMRTPEQLAPKAQ